MMPTDPEQMTNPTDPEWLKIVSPKVSVKIVSPKVSAKVSYLKVPTITDPDQQTALDAMEKDHAADDS